MMARQDTCASARTAHRELGNPCDCFDEPPPGKGPFDDLIPHYGWFGDLLPSCAYSGSGSGSGLFDDIPFAPVRLWPTIAKYLAIAAAPPLVVMVLWWIGAWIAAGFW